MHFKIFQSAELARGAKHGVLCTQARSARVLKTRAGCSCWFVFGFCFVFYQARNYKNFGLFKSAELARGAKHGVLCTRARSAFVSRDEGRAGLCGSSLVILLCLVCADDLLERCVPSVFYDFCSLLKCRKYQIVW